jgi:hypothetical protein
VTRLLPLAALALLGGLPLPLASQITTGFVPPPPPPTPQEVAAADSARASTRDSVVRAERLSMREWVDSAARSLERGGDAVLPVEEVIADSMAVPADSARRALPDSIRRASPDSARRAAPDSLRRPAPARTPPAAPARPPAAAPEFREGAPAPDTATPLPLLLLLGGSLAAAGAGLLRRR